MYRFAKPAALFTYILIQDKFNRFHRVHEICDQSDLAILSFEGSLGYGGCTKNNNRCL